MKEPSNPASAQPLGTVVTFYSFKGGVGRSMALANIAVLLARAGQRVLCIDWDLEAPGLDNYFLATPRAMPSRKPSMPGPAKPGGLLDILESSTPRNLANWRDYVRRRTSADQVQLDFIGSGDDVPDYSARLGKFSWEKFFAKRRGGGDIVENLRKEWKAAYDYVLVDSRTGLTDSSGVCTIQMPDMLVLLFAANAQNTDWCERIAKGVREGRRKLPYDRAFLPIIPVLSRFDAREESDRAAEAMDRIAKQFAPYFADWLPRSVKARDMLNWGLLPYVPRYNFEEALAVEDEPATGAQGLSFYYQLLSRLILARLKTVRGILAGAAVPGAALPPLLPSASELRAELRSDSGAVPRYRGDILSRAEEEPLEAAEALETLAQVCLGSSHPTEAEQLLGDAIRVLGGPAVAKTEEIPRLMGMQADVLADINRTTEAEARHKEALALAVETFGESDARTANARAAFARFLRKQRRNNEASEQFALAVQTYDASPAPSPSGLRRALEDWWGLLDELGQWENMTSVARRVWDGVAADGSSKPADQASALDHYAFALMRNGHPHEAAGHFKTALRLEEEASAEEDPISIGRALNNLAWALGEAGCYEEAESLFRRALVIAEKSLGPEHQIVATVYRNIAGTLRFAGRYGEAEPLFRQALAIAEKTLGAENSEAAAACGGLARVLSEMGNYHEAEQLYRRALAIAEKAFEPGHPGVATACAGLASLLRDTGRHGDAEPLFRRALAIRENKLRKEHPDIGFTLTELAQTLSESGDTTAAEPLWGRGIDLLAKGYGPAHDRTGRARWHFAEHLQRTGRIDEANKEFQAAIDILTQSLGGEHPDTLKAKQAAERVGGDN